jgi:hypothetical protein
MATPSISASSASSPSTSRTRDTTAGIPVPEASPLADPETLLVRVTRAIDALVEAGAPYGGLFPSILDRRTGAMLDELPPPIPGQRTGDRSFLGNNLMHDLPLLGTMYGLAAAGHQDYAAAADRYLARWAATCPPTTPSATGLFPWGEHAYWDLRAQRTGNSYRLRGTNGATRTTHDHLRQAPAWFWEKLWHHNPGAVERFAAGLEYHWKRRADGEPVEYIRHAAIEERVYPPLDLDRRACDFPRHGGFYLVDLACAYGKTARAGFLAHIDRLVDYWWEKRDARCLLRIESRTPETEVKFVDTNTPGQTLSLAISLLETAALIEAALPERAATMRTRALAYVDGFLAAPHDVERGVFVLDSYRSTNALKRPMALWGSVYGEWPAAYTAVDALCAYRLTHDRRLLAWAAAAGRAYTQHPFPLDVQVPSLDAGLALELLADLYDLTGEQSWRDAGLALAQRLLPVYFDAAGLPRGAAGIDWYESQMGPSYLLHGLARVALLARDRTTCPLPPDYTAR